MRRSTLQRWILGPLFALCTFTCSSNGLDGSNLCNSGVDTDGDAAADRFVSPDAVAKTTLDALDGDRLYVLPQLEARMIWRMKRLAPVSYNVGSGVLAYASSIPNSDPCSSGGSASSAIGAVT